MHISWLGGTAIKIQAKPFDTDVTIVIDPYKPLTGEFPRSLAPDIALFTHGQDGAITLSGTPFVMENPGECETKGVLIATASHNAPDMIVIRLDAEDVSIGHLGLTSTPPTGEALEVLSGVDILFVPVGSSSAMSPDVAAKVVASIEPRIVIPIAMHSDNDPKAESATAFLREMGANPEPQKKIIIKQKDLPQEETVVYLLEKE
jgi:L-ascorbate metabolism protein UlaG (beta-lactamase superfamily)